MLPCLLPILGLLSVGAAASAPVCTHQPGTLRLVPVRAALPTCPPSQLQPAPISAEHFPWSREPYCLSTPGHDKHCLFTSAGLNRGRGLSVVMKPELAAQFSADAMLSNAKLQGQKVKYEPRVSPGRGVGLFVKEGEEITAGELILLDFPTLLIAAEVNDEFPPWARQEFQWRAVLQLPDRGRAGTRGLAKSVGGDVDEVDDLMETNSFRQPHGKESYMAVLTEISRINHACRPNAISGVNGTLVSQVVALRDIHAGEEILISYIDAAQERTFFERQEVLSSTWNFRCSCSACSGGEVPASDERIRRITVVKDELYKSFGGPHETTLALAKELLDLYDKEDMFVPSVQIAEIATYAANQMGDEEEARRLARISREKWTVLLGADSVKAKGMEVLETDPTAHPTWGGKRKGFEDEDLEKVLKAEGLEV